MFSDINGNEVIDITFFARCNKFGLIDTEPFCKSFKIGF